MAEQVPFGNVGLAPVNLAHREPRCPCVLLLDTSGSMSEIVANQGQPTGRTQLIDGQMYNIVSGGTTRIDLLNEGIRDFHTDLMTDSLAPLRVEVSVITFGGSVQTVVPFVEASQFVPPTLEANGETPMGAAILQAIDSVNARKQQLRQNGLQLYRPWIFFITDGAPTDDCTAAATKLKVGEAKKQFAFFPVGVKGANFDVLSQLATANSPLPLDGYKFKEMFKWLSASMKMVSQSQPGTESQLQFPSVKGWTSL